MFACARDRHRVWPAAAAGLTRIGTRATSIPAARRVLFRISRAVLTSQKEHSPMRFIRYNDTHTRRLAKSGISQAERASEMPRPEVPSLAPCGGPPSDSNVTTMMSNDMSADGRYSIVCCGSEAAPSMAPSLITRLPEHAHAVCWPGLGVRDSLPWSPSRYFARAGYGRVHLCSSCGGSQGPVTSLHA
jgi:hypothetical protein